MRIAFQPLARRLLPAVPRACSLRDDVCQLGGVDALLRDTPRRAVLSRQRLALSQALRAGRDARVGVARVRNGLSLPVLNVEQPLLRARLAQPDRAALERPVRSSAPTSSRRPFPREEALLVEGLHCDDLLLWRCVNYSTKRIQAPRWQTL